MLRLSRMAFRLIPDDFRKKQRTSNKKQAQCFPEIPDFQWKRRACFLNYDHS